jgi:TPR repeat protein
MDSRKSRLDKLLSIPADHLLLVAREWIFDGSGNYNTSKEHAIKVLTSAAARANEESAWLLDKLHDVPDFEEWRSIIQWFTKIIANEDSSRAQYYQGRSLLHLGEPGGFELVKQLADAGFAPAMSELGNDMEYGDTNPEESVEWLRKGAALNDPDGLYSLAFRVKAEMFELLRKAAIRGHARSMLKITRDFLTRLSLVEAATFSARYVLLSGNNHVVPAFIAEAVCAEDLEILYATGRELEGYEALWDKDRVPTAAEHLKCIDVYLTITHRARRAALQTTLGLRQYLGRDVARLIGQIVYQTRSEAQAWWWQHPPSIKK